MARWLVCIPAYLQGPPFTATSPPAAQQWHIGKEQHGIARHGTEPKSPSPWCFQVATGSLGIGPDPTPQDGDGFTYEHLAHKDELWFDFCADTGDGGDPTYAVARCMAAPQIQARIRHGYSGVVAGAGYMCARGIIAPVRLVLLFCDVISP